MKRIKTNRNKAFALSRKSRGNGADPRFYALIREIKADEMKLEQTKSRTSE